MFTVAAHIYIFPSVVVIMVNSVTVLFFVFSSILFSLCLYHVRLSSHLHWIGQFSVVQKLKQKGKKIKLSFDLRGRCFVGAFVFLFDVCVSVYVYSNDLICRKSASFCQWCVSHEKCATSRFDFFGKRNKLCEVKRFVCACV